MLSEYITFTDDWNVLGFCGWRPKNWHTHINQKRPKPLDTNGILASTRYREYRRYQRKLVSLIWCWKNLRLNYTRSICTHRKKIALPIWLKISRLLWSRSAVSFINVDFNDRCNSRKWIRLRYHLIINMVRILPRVLNNYHRR